MSDIILMVAFAVEALFAAYCIITKSNQSRLRNFVRIGALAAFLFFMLVAVIQWSFRWVGLAALLSIWALLGAWTLIGKKADKKAYKTGPILGKAVGTLLLVLIALTPALIFPQYRQPSVTGKHPVATVNFTYTDPSRIETFGKTGGNREVNVEFWYPADAAGKSPLVVFDHGSFAMKTSNSSTFINLASNGYVVCSIDHPYQSLFTVDANRHMVSLDPAYLQEYLDLNHGKFDGETKFRLESQWMQLRTADINFVLNTILANARDSGSGLVYQLVDPEKIGLMGHSLGGESSAQVARERKDIDAVINLDADLHGEYVDFVNGREVLNTSTYPVPILNILGDDLLRLIAKIPDADSVVAVKHVSATAPNAFEIDFTGTDHMSFTDLPLVSPLMASLINASVPKAGGVEVDKYATIEKMNQTVLEFFNVYLKGEGSFHVVARD